MITAAAFRAFSLAQEGASEAPYFEAASFRVSGRIFATLWEPQRRATLKLTPEQQDMLTAAEPAIFERVPNAWGLKGWTWMHLPKADRAAMESAIKTAHGNVRGAKGTKKRTARKARST